MKRAILLLLIAILFTPVIGIGDSIVLGDENGTWVPYSVDFTGSGPFYADDEQYNAILPANINSGDGVQFNCAGHWFNYKLSGGKIQWAYTENGKEGTKSIGAVLSSTGSANGNKVIYENAFWNTNVVYSAHSYGIKEHFILSTLPSGAQPTSWESIYLEYTGELDWDSGLSVWVGDVEYPDKTFSTSSKVDFRNNVGESVFYLPEPTAWDSGNSTCNLIYDVKVSADKIEYGLKVPYDFLGNAIFPVYIDPWISPTGHNDPDGKWTDETYAYDDDTETYASNSAADYNRYLELTVAELLCDKVRIDARDKYGIPIYHPDLDIDVYYGGAWHNIWSGVITGHTWVEKAIGSSQLVTKARVKSNTSDKNLYLYEFDFNKVEVCSPSIDVEQSSWNINSGNPVSEDSTYNTGLDWCTITNNSGGAVTIYIQGADMVGGGYTWDLSDDASNGDMVYGMHAGLYGGSYNIIVKESATNVLKAGLADSGTQDFGLQIYTPTVFDDGNGKSGAVTITAVCD